MEYIFASLINLKIEVLSYGTDLEPCKTECSKLEGHLPYAFEGKRDFSDYFLSKTLSP